MTTRIMVTLPIEPGSKLCGGCTLLGPIAFGYVSNCLAFLIPIRNEPNHPPLRCAACLAAEKPGERDPLTDFSATFAASALRDAVNNSCTCGGMGPNDPGVCGACLVWHRLRRT
jgi:hypothetical protein